MIVISLTDCPPRIRGDLSKWLCEINTGVYVGRLSARVRDELWDRICENLRSGRATMVYSSNSEQGFDFRVHNTTWEPVDFDGVTLMRRPCVQSLQASQFRPAPPSNAQIQRMASRQRAARLHGGSLSDYCVIDLETTGLSAADAHIIEIAAIRVIDGNVTESFSRLIRVNDPIPEDVVHLTGITDSMLAQEGVPVENALQELLSFLGEQPVVGHNIAFDIAFLRAACSRSNILFPRLRTVDTLDLARRTVLGLPSFKLERLAEYYHLDSPHSHRAMNDCLLTQQLYTRLLVNQSD